MKFLRVNYEAKYADPLPESYQGHQERWHA